MTDPAALANYRRRLGELDADLDSARDGGDHARVERLLQEREALLAELRRVTGLGGRIRNKTSSDERARLAVAWRIRHAIRKIREVHPALGAHLANSIRTGSTCRYQPETPVVWQL